MVGLGLGMVVVGLGNLSVGLGVFSRLRQGIFGGMKGEANERGKKGLENIGGGDLPFEGRKWHGSFWCSSPICGFCGIRSKRDWFYCAGGGGFVVCWPAGGSLRDTYFFYCSASVLASFLYLYLVIT